MTTQAHRKMINFPLDQTSFIGRRAELAEITAVFAKPSCRLLTLLGPGGIGKTRLATQVAAAQADGYANGVFFVPLQAVDTPDMVVATIADVLDFPLASREEPALQLQKYLQAKEMLLVLDNFEQLLSQGGNTIVRTLLTTIPHVDILVTSRERLHLPGEWVYALRGLSYPQDDNSAESAHFESVQLFAERAGHVNHRFSLADELEHVAHIAQMVEGIPLALELAASWTKLLPCRDIAAEIGKNLDLLQTAHKNLPHRHQSIRLIFDHTWEQLTQPERDVFMRLSIFRGGFQREAATAVAGATLPLLSQLQDKALLQWRANGRYYLHELLRQYGAEKLAQDEDASNQLRLAHCNYYARYLNEQEQDLMGQRQVAATLEIEAELQNIQDAWQCAIENGKVPVIRQAAFALGNFYQFQSRYAEGLQMFEQATAKLTTLPETEATRRALIDALMVCSWFYLRFGQPKKVAAAMRQSQALHQQLNIDPGPGYVTDPAVLFSFANLIQGNFAAAITAADQALETAVRCRHPGNQKFAHYLLAQAAMAQGDLETAQQQAHKAFAIVQAAEDRWFMAYVLNTLADIAAAENDFNTARKHYQASYEIRQAFHDTEGMAVALNHLSDIALRQENYQDARTLFSESLELYQDINDVGGLATSYHGLGYTAVKLQDYDAARQHYLQALQLAADIRYVPLILTLLVSVGELYCRLGQVTAGMSLFAFVQEHQAANQETREQAEQLQNSFKLQIKPEQMATAVAQGQTTDLEGIIDQLLTALPLLDLSIREIPTTVEDPNQALVEPLTAREQEVLAHLADGHTNREIADQLVIAEGTVKYYTRQIYGKLQVHNRTQAVTLAQELGLV